MELFFGGPFGLFFLVPIMLVGMAFVVLLIVVVLLVRPEQADPHGRRPYATYVFSTLFASVLVLLGGLGGIAAAIGSAVSGTPDGGGVECATAVTGGIEERSMRARATRAASPTPEPTIVFPSLVEPAQPEVRRERIQIERVSPEATPLFRQQNGLETPFPPTSIVPVRQPECRYPSSGSLAGALAIRAGLIAAAAAAVLLFHADRARELLAKEAFHG